METALKHFIYDGVDYGESEGECKLEMYDGKIYGKPKYEIIGGEKFIMSPAPNLTHSIIVKRLLIIFDKYITENNIKAEVFGDNTDVYFNQKEHYMPDVSVVCDFEKIKNGKKILGAPDLIVEILSRATMKNDRTKKFFSYEKFGVKEYWIVDPLNKSVEVYHLVEGKFILDEIYSIADDDDEDEDKDEIKTKIKVSIFEDLTIDIHKIFKMWFEQ